MAIVLRVRATLTYTHTSITANESSKLQDGSNSSIASKQVCHMPELFVELLQLSLKMAIFLLVTTYGTLQHLVIILMSCQARRGATITSLVLR